MAPPHKNTNSSFQECYLIGPKLSRWDQVEDLDTGRLSLIVQMGPKFKHIDIYILIRRSQREISSHIQRECEDEQWEIWRCWAWWLEWCDHKLRNVSSHQNQEEARNKNSPLQLPEGAQLFWDLNWGQDADFNAVSFSATKFVVVCYSSNVKLTQ